MSPSRYPNLFSSSYTKIEDFESCDSPGHPNQDQVAARRFFPGYRIAFFAVSTLYVISMAVTLPMLLQPDIFQRKLISSSSIPDIPQDQTVVFNGYVDFEVERTKDDAWSKLIPLGRGFVEMPVEVPQEDGGVEVKNEYFCISMFHQLHCIAGLKSAFEKMSKENNTAHTDHSSHLAHCFDYLRQGVMCAGDMTLEPTFDLTGEDAGVKAVNGWNVEHQCKNYHTMYDFAEQHRYENTTGI